ncbi:thymidine phosphorylase [candidate division WOR-3 bacterium]|nr:thymidine phosphorylase [candidate division WOR-3 bacterium]
MREIIRKKRDGQKLDKSDIEFFINGVTTKEIPNYQISALLMAIFYKGMNLEETKDLTYFMLNSGKKLDLSGIKGPKIDKHSTGGVGDKISLILAPLAAEMGIIVPMITGRGLGHTGGTSDKMEAIPGYKTSLTFGQFERVLRKTGCSIISQTREIAPADKELYALRDATETVESVALITSSILSKKLAEDLDGLVIDLKVGEGAFMKDLASAKKLGEMMKKVGEELGTEMKIVFTDQSSPIGRNIGNAPEVIESVEILKGNLTDYTDTLEITKVLAEEMCSLAGIKVEILETLKSGKVFERFEKMVSLQGGDLSGLTTYKKSFEVKSTSEGIVEKIDAYKIGIAALKTGAGREKKEDNVDLKAGIKLLKVAGEEVRKGEALALVYTKKELEPIKESILSAYSVGKKLKKDKTKILEKW